MTNRFNANFDRMARAAMLTVGVADKAIFKRDGVSLPCTVYVDRGVQLIGDQSQVVNDQITLTAFLDQILVFPGRGDQFTTGAYDALGVFVPGDTFVVDSISKKDESAVVCIVRAGC